MSDPFYRRFRLELGHLYLQCFVMSWWTRQESWLRQLLYFCGNLKHRKNITTSNTSVPNWNVWTNSFQEHNFCACQQTLVIDIKEFVGFLVITTCYLAKGSYYDKLYKMVGCFHFSYHVTYLIHYTDESTTHHALSHIFDLVYHILGLLYLLQQYTDVCTSVYLLLLARSKEK